MSALNSACLGKDRVRGLAGFVHDGTPWVSPHRLSRPPPLGLASLYTIHGFEVLFGTGWASKPTRNTSYEKEEESKTSHNTQKECEVKKECEEYTNEGSGKRIG